MAGGTGSKLHEFVRSACHSDNFKLVPLQGNGTNRHFRVACNSHYFLKEFVTNSLQVVDRHEQFQIQRQLALQNLAPLPVALSKCQTYWLEEWCNPSELVSWENPQDPESISDANLTALADTLAKIHRCAVQAPMLDLNSEWLRYLAISNTQNDSRLQCFIDVLKENWHSSDLCFCHNDLHHSHVLQLAPVRVVDWEYAAIGNRYFDIAACARVNDLSDQKLSMFIEQYALNIAIPIWKIQEGVQLMIPIVDFTNELWHNAYNQIT